MVKGDGWVECTNGKVRAISEWSGGKRPGVE